MVSHSPHKGQLEVQFFLPLLSDNGEKVSRKAHNLEIGGSIPQSPPT